VFAVWITARPFAAVDRDLELAARNLGASGLRTVPHVSLPLAAPGILASAIFVFLESLDEFTGTFFVGVPDVITPAAADVHREHRRQLPDRRHHRADLLVPSVVFMLIIERFLKADVLSKVGA
jgi:ABC-type spermidine/putrescine transport system permease subunit II